MRQMTLVAVALATLTLTACGSPVAMPMAPSMAALPMAQAESAKKPAWQPKNAAEKAVEKAVIDYMENGGEEAVYGLRSLEFKPGQQAGTQFFYATVFARNEVYETGYATGTYDPKTGKVKVTQCQLQ